MIKRTLAITAIASLVLFSCKETPSSTLTAPTSQTENGDQTIVTEKLTNPDGSEIEITFNHDTELAMVNFNGETIELESQKPASGIWYKNDQYELTGKGQNLELKKNGEIVFVHEGAEPIVTDYTNEDGTTLTLNVYNDAETATIVFDGETIDLMSQQPASGIWYKNDQYDLSGKGQQITPKKDGKVIFEHKGEEPIVTDYTNKEGKSLTINVYNDTETATVVFDGETIDLVSQKPASGVWYKNDQYEFSGKGDDVELKKDGKTIFTSK